MAIIAVLVLLVGHQLCFAVWMTAYHRDTELLGLWHNRAYQLLAGFLLLVVVEVFLALVWRRSGRGSS